MSEWWTYRPSDFLMFSPRIYWRLFESLNAQFWPWQALVAVAGLVWLGGFARTSRGTGAAGHAARHADGHATGQPMLRVALFAIALSTGFVAWVFFVQRYAPINWAASAAAVAFALQGLGLAALAVFGGVRASSKRGVRLVGGGLLLWALLGHPLLAVWAGRPWTQAEVFGLAPDPTAIAALGLLLLLDGTRSLSRAALAGLWLVPLLWCAASAATLWTMGSAQGGVPFAAALLAVLVRLRR